MEGKQMLAFHDDPAIKEKYLAAAALSDKEREERKEVLRTQAEQLRSKDQVSCGEGGEMKRLFGSPGAQRLKNQRFGHLAAFRLSRRSKGLQMRETWHLEGV
jgi:hypothetical protein